MRSVTIVGPNLRDQSRGEFNVHAEGCADLARSAGRDPAFEHGYTMQAASRAEIVDAMYPPEDFDCESGQYMGEFHFAPCIESLPERIAP